MSDSDSGALTEVLLPFTAATLEYVLQFLENRPVVVRELEFPRDWETMRALSELSVRTSPSTACRRLTRTTLQIWRGIDSFQTSLSCVPTYSIRSGTISRRLTRRKQPLDPTLLAPAFCFALHFSYPSSLRQVAIGTAKHCHADPEAVKELTKGLMEGARELEFEGEKMGRLFELVSRLHSCRKPVCLTAHRRRPPGCSSARRTSTPRATPPSRPSLLSTTRTTASTPAAASYGPHSLKRSLPRTSGSCGR